PRQRLRPAAAPAIERRRRRRSVPESRRLHHAREPRRAGDDPIIAPAAGARDGARLSQRKARYPYGVPSPSLGAAVAAAIQPRYASLPSITGSTSSAGLV